MESFVVLAILSAAFYAIRGNWAGMSRDKLNEDLLRYIKWTRSEKYQDWAYRQIGFWSLDRNVLFDDYVPFMPINAVEKYLDKREDAAQSFLKFREKGNAVKTA